MIESISDKTILNKTMLSEIFLNEIMLNKKRLSSSFLVLLLMCIQASHALANSDHEEVGGLVFSHYQSQQAHDFVRGFLSVWLQNSTKGNESISIKESLASLNNTQIVINHQFKSIYRKQLNRRTDNTDNGRQAAEYVISTLKSLATKRNSDIDLAEDEF